MEDELHAIVSGAVAEVEPLVESQAQAKDHGRNIQKVYLLPSLAQKLNIILSSPTGRAVGPEFRI